MMVWAGIYYRQRGMHFTDANLNGQHFSDEILRPNVIPFVEFHYLPFQQAFFLVSNR